MMCRALLKKQRQLFSFSSSFLSLIILLYVLCFSRIWNMSIVYSLDAIDDFLRKLYRRLVIRVLGWIIEHSCANTVTAVGPFQHVHIDTTVASPPKSFIVREVGECNRNIT